MGSKQVRVCDRCGIEREYFSTTEWTEVLIALSRLDLKERADRYDLCGHCTSELRLFIAEYQRPQIGAPVSVESGHSAMMCEHANEVPARCPCDADCYCKTHTCKHRGQQ